jgi:purine-nucleoside phosphorylase
VKATTRNDLGTLVDSLRAQGVGGARLAFVLGSGLGGFADRIENPRVLAYEDLRGMPRSAVPGHAGKLIVGELAGTKVVCQQGRVHLYEGWSVEEVTRCVRAFAAIGVQGVLLTNAAGGVNGEWSVPTLMHISDHLNLQGKAYIAPSQAGFVNPYDPELGAALQKGAGDSGVQLRSGIYAGLLGPTYETPSEVRMLGKFGASAIGMSTVNEALAAHACGARVAAVSCITNLGAGITGEKLSHEEVVEAGKQIAEDFCALLAASVPHLRAALEREAG